jgi:CheY-like chemotaxis protein
MTKSEFGNFNYLVVDDDDLSQEVLAASLRSLGGQKIFFANDSASACQLAQWHRPDFVLLDIYMPGLDGWALLKQLRQLLPKASILMVTGSRLPADFNKSMDQRVDGYCIKPVMPDVMEKALIGARQRRFQAK